jgi:predicted nuclease of predicted toxin-antitoxin system
VTLIWLDEQLSPSLAGWISRRFKVSTTPVRELGLQNASDRAIFFAAREAGAVVLTKDQDFVRMLELHGPPPRIVWITCGNTSNQRMQIILEASPPGALELLEGGEAIVEISDAR